MRSQIVLGICITLLVAGSLHAATRTFTGAVDQLWSNAGNWDAIPEVGDKARVRSEKPCILDYDAGVINQYVGEGGTVGHLILVDGAQLSVRTWNIIGYNGGEPDNRHTIEVLGGVLNGGHPDYPNNGRIFVGREGYATLIIDYTGVVNMHHQALQVGQGNGGDGIVEVRGGELNLNDNGLTFRAGANSNASMDFSGGVMTQVYTADRLAYINDHIADGTITAYGKVVASYGTGTVLVETIDDTIVVKGLHPFNPVPEDDGNVVPGTVTLEWTVDAGTPVDVWFGSKADLSDFTKIVDKKTVTATTVTTVAKQRYFWAVDTYAPDATQPEIGIVFDFVADNQPPVVETGDDVTTWLANGSVDVALAGTVTDADPTTTVWTVVSEPDDPDSPDAAIADPAALNTSITLSALGEYVLQLQADDGEYQGADTLTISVFSDHCEAAKSLPGWVPLPGDINLDCVVDQVDMDILTENWLGCNGLECPDPSGP
ncbi:MAG: hypothetical protein JSU65_03655 [Candidatus Zixiibacteriota bacterium]|nr:MAG: hypothetical protein JSU65_03655 [candidate division Zixibacteria bacterium]